MFGKKLTALILALGIIFTLAACSDKDSSAEEQVTESELTIAASEEATEVYTNKLFDDFTKKDESATEKTTVSEVSAGESIEAFCENISKSEIHNLPPEIADTSKIDDEYIIKYFIEYYSGISYDGAETKTIDGKKYAVVSQSTLSTLLNYTFRVKSLPRPTKAENSSCYYEKGLFYIAVTDNSSTTYNYEGLTETADGFVATLSDGKKTCSILLAEDSEGCYVKAITIK